MGIPISLSDDSLNERKIHGVIDHWHSSEERIHGYIHMDRKERFTNGQGIHTSLVIAVSEWPLVEGSYIQTTNSFYRLGKEAKEEGD